jgi:hypothetical protein
MTDFPVRVVWRTRRPDHGVSLHAPEALMKVHRIWLFCAVCVAWMKTIAIFMGKGVSGLQALQLLCDPYFDQ